MDPRRATKRLKARLVPSTGGEWFLAAFVLVVV